MQQDTASFWSDIKTLDARLAENPDSLCFAQLANVYLKVGLADDALHLARRGVERHPRYVAGQRSLAYACHAKDLQEECCTALEYVTSSTPEDVDAQKMLAQIYLQEGNKEAAQNCFKTALEFSPDDSECLIQLAAMQPTPSILQTGSESSVTSEEDGEIEELEEADILEIDDLDIIDEESDVESFSTTTSIETTDAGLKANLPVEHVDPLSTATLAELYVKQGFIEKALVIYRALLADNPDNRDVVERVRELELQTAPVETCTGEANLTPSPEPRASSQLSQPPVTAPACGSADNKVSILSTWLENIRRIKSCR